MKRISQNLKKLEQWIHHAAEWPYLAFVLFGVSLLDFFVFVISADLFLIAAILGKPSRAFSFSLAIILGRAVGLIVFYYVGVQIPLSYFHDLATGYGLEGQWVRSLTYVEDFGPAALSVISWTPFPMQFVVLICAASKVSIWRLQLFLFLGLTVRYSVLAFALIYGKKVFGFSKKGN